MCYNLIYTFVYLCIWKYKVIFLRFDIEIQKVGYICKFEIYTFRY